MQKAALMLLVALACAIAINRSVVPVVHAQEARVRLYACDGGLLTVPDPSGFGLTKAEVPTTDMAVSAFLVVHPKGRLLWDTGLGDDLVGRTAAETQRGRFGQTVKTSLRSQLAALGYTPADITYLALSHSHFDHVGNAKDYAGSTWLTPRAERDMMFGDDASRQATIPANVAPLKNSKTTIIDGDHDVVGDGTVVIKATPGHTPGHQSLFVKLVRTGPVVLSGDLYHYPAERTLNRMPPQEAATGRTAASRQALEEFMAKTRAQLWIQHDLDHWRELKKCPDFYD